ncbi:hypothetical protein TSUD_252550 [Trifolium subterraneum]|nr:hypothetical protein TSUD_252550 [Trifolium subterraneum]
MTAAGLEHVIQPRLQHYSNAGDVILQLCNNEDRMVAGQVVMLLWVLWNNRNNSLWNDLKEPGRSLGIKAMQLWQEWNSVQQQQQQIHTNLNRTSFGWCVRDHLGAFVVAGTGWRMGNHSIDSFYNNLTEEERARVQDYNFDHPDAFDTEELLRVMDKLKHGEAVDLPKYDFKIYKSDALRRVNSSDVIILEGILVFHDPRVRELMNMKIFVDTDADVRLARRIRRDTSEKDRDIGAILDQYSKFVKPAFDDFILPTKKYADIIIPRGGDNHVAVDLIVQHIRTKLGQHDLCKIYPNLYVIQSTFQIRGMHTLIRDAQITKHDFVFYADRLIRLVVEHGLGHLPFTEKQVVTPTGSVYTGVDFCKRLCGVSVIRRY